MKSIGTSRSGASVIGSTDEKADAHHQGYQFPWSCILPGSRALGVAYFEIDEPRLSDVNVYGKYLLIYQRSAFVSRRYRPGL
jgi:hypothetical protein